VFCGVDRGGVVQVTKDSGTVEVLKEMGDLSISYHLYFNQ